MSWEKLSYNVSVKEKGKKSRKELLNNISGYVRPGMLLALMGPSGAGKVVERSRERGEERGVREERGGKGKRIDQQIRVLCLMCWLTARLEGVWKERSSSMADQGTNSSTGSLGMPLRSPLTLSLSPSHSLFLCLCMSNLFLLLFFE